MIWIVIITLLLVLSYIGEYASKPAARLAIILIVLLLSYLVAFGGSLAADYHNYAQNYRRYTSFHDVVDLSSIITFEKSTTTGVDTYGPVFRLLCYLCYKCGLSGTGFIFVVTLITNSFLMKFICKFRNVFVIWLLIILEGFLLTEANLIRQSLCISIFLFSLSYLKDRKLFKYILLITISSLIHYSSVFLYLISLLLFIKNDRQMRVVSISLVFITIVSFVASIGIFNVGNFWQIPVLSLLLGDSIYSGYMTNENIVGASITINYFYNFAVLFLLFYRKREDFIYTSVLCLGCILGNLSVIIPNFYRLSLYFTLLYPILFTSLFWYKNYKAKYKPLIMVSETIILTYNIMFSLLYVMVINDANVIGKVFLPLSSMFL